VSLEWVARSVSELDGFMRAGQSEPNS